MHFSATFSLSLGLLMLVQWTASLLSGNVPELQTAPWRIAFHLAAEFLTAIMLIISAELLFRNHRLGRPVFLISAGMAVYAMLNSAGYFAQSGDWSFVLIFAVLLVLTGVSVTRVVGKKYFP